MVMSVVWDIVELVVMTSSIMVTIVCMWMVLVDRVICEESNFNLNLAYVALYKDTVATSGYNVMHQAPMGGKRTLVPIPVPLVHFSGA